MTQCTPADLSIAWNGTVDLTALNGTPVQLRFEVRNIGMFSFQVDQQ